MKSKVLFLATMVMSVMSQIAFAGNDPAKLDEPAAPVWQCEARGFLSNGDVSAPVIAQGVNQDDASYNAAKECFFDQLDNCYVTHCDEKH